MHHAAAGALRQRASFPEAPRAQPPLTAAIQAIACQGEPDVRPPQSFDQFQDTAHEVTFSLASSASSSIAIGEPRPSARTSGPRLAPSDSASFSAYLRHLAHTNGGPMWGTQQRSKGCSDVREQLATLRVEIEMAARKPTDAKGTARTFPASRSSRCARVSSAPPKTDSGQSMRKGAVGR
ncbi:MAG: hypothetical protein JWM63_1099 [Gammaproteobacteria bacterium]|nr:hypothetical protein [Gammaproteobacteria bacterium]